MEQYTSEAARRDWRRILDRIQLGEQVEITRYGELLAAVVPVKWRDEATAALAVQDGAQEPDAVEVHP